MKAQLHSTWPSVAPVRPNTNPFIHRAFLTALEQQGICTEKRGWQPLHHQVSEHLLVPAYIKTDSWGEYVFDWAWAQAYEQHGLAYFPKLIVAAPFTPSMGPRLLGAQNQDDASAIVEALQTTCREKRLSGVHVLFPDQHDQALLRQTQLIERTDVQFHWQNLDYRDFDDFLDRFASRKRKNVRKERASVAAQGIHVETREGEAISADDLLQFYQFYHATYLKRGRHGYLTHGFFAQLLSDQAENLVLFLAYKDSLPIAAALCFKTETTLYGRYWGCFDEYDNLHFETCYYQGIEYCIRNGLQHFDPGTQGEHKIARGFEPTYTHSYHWLLQSDFHSAIARYCKQERSHIDLYFQQTTQSLPFKVTANPASQISLSGSP